MFTCIVNILKIKDNRVKIWYWVNTWENTNKKVE